MSETSQSPDTCDRDGSRQPYSNSSKRPHPPRQNRGAVRAGIAVWRVTEKPKCAVASLETNPVSKMFRRSEHCSFRSSTPCFCLNRPREARQLQSGRRREARASRALRFGRGGASRRLRRPKSAFSFNHDVLVKSMTLYKVFTLSHACMFATHM